MSKRLIPKNDKILLRPIEEGHPTYGNLIIPDMGQEKPKTGEVLAVGPGRYEFGTFIENETEVGQIVLIPKLGSMQIEFEGDIYYLVAEREIIAVVQEY